MSKDRNEGKSFNQLEKDKFSEKPKRRTFLGTFPGNGKKLNAFEKKELRAYTRGHSNFVHGRDLNGTPVTHTTRVAYV